MPPKLEVLITGDTKNLERSLSSAGRASHAFGTALKVGAVAGVVALGAAAKVAWDDMLEGAKVSAQTQAVLKSTGEAAKVTAGHVSNLATAISNYSGIDDEAVQAGENMLLTFTNIQNRVGKGNDIFDQATKILADMSTALGQDMPKSAIQLGKALNDPVKGVTALQKVGVTFTDQQKKSIAAMVKQGEVAKAQKVILRELTKEFGGSAKAAGDSLPGQINKLKNSFTNLGSSILSNLAPALTAGLKELNSFLTRLNAVKGIKAKIAVVFGEAQEVAITLKERIMAAVRAIDWHAVWDRATGIGEGFAAKIGAALKKVDWAASATALLAGLGAAISAGSDVLGPIIRQVILQAINISGQLAQPIAEAGAKIAAQFFVTITDPAFWARNWELALTIAVSFGTRGFGRLGARLAPEIARMAETLGLKLAGELGRLGPIFLEGFTRLGPLMKRGATAAFDAIPALVRRLFRTGFVLTVTSGIEDMAAAIAGGAQTVAAKGKELGSKVVSGIETGLATIASLGRKITGGVGNAISGALSFVFNAAKGIGQAIVSGIVSGIESLAGTIKDKIVSAAQGALSGVKHALGIGSPSKKFAREVGKPITEGIAVGILAGNPKLIAALKKTTGLAEDQLKGVAAIIVQYRKLGLDPAVGLAISMREAGGIHPGAVGDSGTSFGLFQLHKGGALGSLSPEQAKDPLINAGVAARALARLLPGARGAAGIAAQDRGFERPQDIPGAIRTDVASYSKALQILSAFDGGKLTKLAGPGGTGVWGKLKDLGNLIQAAIFNADPIISAGLKIAARGTDIKGADFAMQRLERTGAVTATRARFSAEDAARAARQSPSQIANAGQIAYDKARMATLQREMKLVQGERSKLTKRLKALRAAMRRIKVPAKGKPGRAQAVEARSKLAQVIDEVKDRLETLAWDWADMKVEAQTLGREIADLNRADEAEGGDEGSTAGDVGGAADTGGAATAGAATGGAGGPEPGLLGAGGFYDTTRTGFEALLALSRLTPYTSDDLFYLRSILGLDKEFLAAAQAAGDNQAIIALASEIKSLTDEINSLTGATADNTTATQDNTQTQKDAIAGSVAFDYRSQSYIAGQSSASPLTVGSAF